MMFPAIMLFFLSLLLLPLIAFISSSSGKEALIEKGRVLSQHGIDSSNQAEAIDILLRLTTSNYEHDHIVGFRWWYLTIPVTLLGLIVLVQFRPYSVIGIGNGANAVVKWERRKTVLHALVVLWGVGIACAVLGAWIYDTIKLTANP